MNRIEQIFRRLRSDQNTAVMPFVTGGYPTPEALPELLHACARGGAHCVEIGFPFSDPIADGPVIASAMNQALAQGITPQIIFEQVAGVRSTLDLGLIAMVSQSIMTRMGIERFVRHCVDAGIDGLIVPDLDLENASEIQALAEANSLILSLLVAPTTSDARLERLLAHCSGFVYMLARLGITGEQHAMPQLEPLLARLRARTDLPVVAGFGISTPEHVQAIAAEVDAVIVGSALIRRMRESNDPTTATEAFVRQLAEAAIVRP
jgi:tryptophan synthase alpha chain